MNRSYSKIRHIQEANMKLEKRLLKEASMDQSKIKMGSKNVLTCFDSKKYPNLDKVSGGSIKTVFGLLMMWSGIAGEALSFGLSTIPSGLAVASGFASEVKGLHDLLNANYSKIDNELKSLWKCVFG